MKTSSRKENRRYWQDQVRRSRAHRGSLASYCRQAGIGVSALNYWRKKLSNETASAAPARSPFVAVELAGSAATVPARGSHLPDPKWVAQLILQLSQGGLQ